MTEVLAVIGLLVLGGCVGALGVVLTERVVDSYKAQKYLAKDVQLQVLQLRDKTVGHSQQVFAGLRWPQAAPFAVPDLRAQLLFQLAHGVAQCGLCQVQLLGGSGKRAVLVYRTDDGKVDTFELGH